jgi:arginase family enzyme
MELFYYLNPIEFKNDINQYHPSQMFFISKNTIHETIALEGIDIAIIGVTEERNTKNKGTSMAPDEIRQMLYGLQKPTRNIKIADLGNLKNGNTINDTYFGLRDVIIELMSKNILPIIIGGGNDLVFANFLAYQKLEKVINIVAIDAKFDLGDAENEFNSESYLSKIVLEYCKNLFNYTNIGNQSYFVGPDETEIMNKMFFDTYRLGIARADLKETEPFIRDGDLISFDINSIKQSDAPGNKYPSPNGFFSHEACQLARYAGMSDRVTSFGIYEVNPLFDSNHQTTQLAAQIIWHFIEGFYQRKNDYPKIDVEQYTKFIVNLVNEKFDLVFYKSKKSERWWMEIPYPSIKQSKKLIVSCSYDDYLTASKQELPNKYWKYYQKIS